MTCTNVATYTGKMVDPLRLHPKDIDIEDIAHSLSNLCRYNGHSVMFYSVAEHSVLTSRMVTEEARLYALLHDATEAYLSDIPSPIKWAIPQIGIMEERIWTAVCARFDLKETHRAEVKVADLRMLCTEKRFAMEKVPDFENCEGIHPYPIPGLAFMSPASAKEFFLNEYRTLING